MERAAWGCRPARLPAGCPSFRPSTWLSPLVAQRMTLRHAPARAKVLVLRGCAKTIPPTAGGYTLTLDGFGARGADDGDHEGVRPDGRERRRGLRAGPGRDTRPPRRERRRQDHPDGDSVRDGDPGRRRGAAR